MLGVDARRLWTEGNLDQRQRRFQKVIFPNGVSYSNQSGFGTTETSLFFRWLALVKEEKEGLASPTRFETLLGSAPKKLEVLSMREFKKLKGAKSA